MPVSSETQKREQVPNQGIAQTVLLKADRVSAAGRYAKQQNQAGLTLPMVD